jgi:hypothetical protein
MEAVESFLVKDRRFERDPTKEKFHITFNPKGYLKRVSQRRIKPSAHDSKKKLRQRLEALA